MISDSAYAMWRTVFSLAHIDGIITDEEKKFMRDILYDTHFSLEQKNQLESDIEIAQNPVVLYQKITRDKHKEKFFQLAKTMVWIDGDYAEDERQVIERLRSLKPVRYDNMNIDGGNDGTPVANQNTRLETMIELLKDIIQTD